MKRDEEHIVFFRDLDPEQVAEARRRLADDARGRQLLRNWLRVRDELGARMTSDASDHDLFVLSALSRSGRGHVLSPVEKKQAEEGADDFRSALADHPGLDAIARDIGVAAAEFEAAWDSWFADVPEPYPPQSERAPQKERAPQSERAPQAERTPQKERAPQRERAAPRERAPRRSSRRSRWAVRTAIGTAVVVFAVVLTLLIRRDQSMVSIETAANQVRVIELGYGSTVRLLGDSRLTYVPPKGAGPLSGRADLEGRGFFEIAAGDRGFIVTTPNAQATVLGTSFSVRSDALETEVILAEGSLSLAPRRTPEQVVVLQPGQMSVVSESHSPAPPVDVTIHEALAWTGLFVFSSTPVDEILRELSRHYETDLSAAPELTAERVTGRFEREQPLLEILEVVAAAVGATVESTSENGYRLVPR